MTVIHDAAPNVIMFAVAKINCNILSTYIRTCIIFNKGMRLSIYVQLSQSGFFGFKYSLSVLYTWEALSTCHRQTKQLSTVCCHPNVRQLVTSILVSVFQSMMSSIACLLFYKTFCKYLPNVFVFPVPVFYKQNLDSCTFSNLGLPRPVELPCKHDLEPKPLLVTLQIVHFCFFNLCIQIFRVLLCQI